MRCAKSIFFVLIKAILAVMPALVCMFLLLYFFNANIFNFYPAYDIDQYYYFREAKTFASAVFNGGYYGSNDLVAKVGRYGPHGLAYPLVYGGVAKLLGGWRDWLVPTLNMVFLTAAIAWSIKELPVSRAMILALFLVVFSPIITYLPLGYQEAPQYALALLLSGPLAALGALDRPVNRKTVVLALVVVFVASLTRPTWAVLFPAIFFCALPGRLQDVFWALGAGGGLLAIAYGVFSLTASPWDVQAGVSLLTSLLHGDPEPLFSRLVPNLESLLRFADNRHHSLTLCVVLGGTMLAVVPALAHSKSMRRRLAFLHVCNVFVPCFVYITIYNGTGYQLTRLLSAHFLLSLAVVVRTAPLRSARIVFAPVLAACLGMLPASLGNYALSVRPSYDDYDDLNDKVSGLSEVIRPFLVGVENDIDPWRRTMGVMHDNIIEPALAVPDFYGIQAYSSWGLERSIRSGFILLSHDEGVIAGKHTKLNPLVSTRHGILYRNEKAFASTSLSKDMP